MVKDQLLICLKTVNKGTYRNPDKEIEVPGTPQNGLLSSNFFKETLKTASKRHSL